ncbi:MAG: geranylgeranyl reductase family protein [Acidobacteria bacterium]|nr:geranylgeranyl reductase family protein [Acidobacteriota bacterium]
MPSLDVLVVGGGPGGCAAGYWLARQGVSVSVIEKKTYPRAKTCGDGLTPRAIKQLIDMGFDFDIPEIHKIKGLRAYAGDLVLEMPWPERTTYPNWGASIRRADLDGAVAELARSQGAKVREGTEAVAVIEDWRLIAVDLKTADGSVERVFPKIVIIADGSLSRFGRALAVQRRRDYPYALAVRTYYRSPYSTNEFIESQLDIRDKDGRSLPGYGWVFPLGDGTINVGVGVLSTFKGWKEVNTSHMLESYVARLPEHWQVSENDVLQPPTGGKLPMAMSVGPKVGANWLVIGDAAGAANPFNGEGIDYAYETGRMAADVIVEALAANDLALLHRYSQVLDDEYAAYYKVARIFVNVIGNPSVMKALTQVGLRSRPLMEWTLKVMANLLEPEEYGMSERVYKAIEKVVRFVPK